MPRPSDQDAARRLVVLRAIVEYARLGQASDPAGMEAFLPRLRQAGFWKALSPEERRFAERRPADLSREDFAAFARRLESVAALLWALGRLERMPPYDQFAGPECLEAVPRGEASEFIRNATLREAFDLFQQRSLAEFWHWRCRTRELEEAGQTQVTEEKLRDAGFHTWDQLVRFSAKKAQEEGVFPEAIDEDFPVRGRAYRDLDAETWGEIRDITRERHFAFNWLCGFSPRNAWDETPLE